VPPPPAAFQAAPAGPPVANPDGAISLPLDPILASLPPNLAALVASPAHGTFSLPVKTALAQLASGAVRIPFGELRQGSPPGTFYDNATQDRSLVSLPLAQILASLHPALLARRSGQKTIAVPENVTSVFGLGRNLQPPIAPAPKPVQPPAPVSVPKLPEPEPGASHFTRRPGVAPLPSLAPKAPAPSASSPPFPVPKAPAMPSPLPLPEEKEDLLVALSLLSESWPPSVLQAIGQEQLQNAIVSLPLSRLESGLKAGRVVFAWGELCQWLLPPLLGNSLPNREVVLELPLKVVAPLFLAHRRPGTAPKKLTAAAHIPGHIPNLFGKSPGAPETAVSALAPAPAATAAAGSGLGEIFGLPGRIEWTPPEICRRICALEGVAGGALAMSDGLVLAAHLPPALNPDTVAAFLPQIFARVSQSAGAMQLGPVTSVALTAGQGRCAIYKTGKLFLAVLGHPGATLPEAMLGRIAAELAKRNP
jgi:predicted regulator of Ras-like GTPase activity (Roadblock/LC7/MglB family)